MNIQKFGVGIITSSLKVKLNKIIYVRFVVPQISEISKSFLGVFEGAAQLIEIDNQPSYIISGIKDEISWFNLNLDEPDYFRKNFNEVNKGVCWFKPFAKEHLKHAWNLVSLCEEAGLAIHFLKSYNPGAIIWEDDYQIVAKPWKRHKDGVYRT